MGVSSYDDLIEHRGHKIEVVTYGPGGKPPWHNVSLECLTCDRVLVDYDNPGICGGCGSIGSQVCAPDCRVQRKRDHHAKRGKRHGSSKG